MKTLLKNAFVVNVFLEKIEKTNVLIDNDVIVGLGDYPDDIADQCVDYAGKYVCPSFIDAHIHIESTFLTPFNLSKICVKHGTTAIVADPHEIANVCGKDGIKYMIQSSKNLPIDVYFTLPSCVPATKFDESFTTLNAEDLTEFYAEEKVVALAEMMNYVGVNLGDREIFKKIEDAKKHGRIINGHAPLLSGKALDNYISAGIYDDHECTNLNEAVEKFDKGMSIFVRYGTSTKSLPDLLPMFTKPYSNKCALVTDDMESADLICDGHVDNIIRKAVEMGADVIEAIKMATINPAKHYGLKNLGAIATGYKANLVVLNDLEKVDVCDVYKNGVKVVTNKVVSPFPMPKVDDNLVYRVKNSFNLDKLCDTDFYIEPKKDKKVRVIKLVKNSLLTEQVELALDFNKNNGVDIDKDILKLAVIERHKNTGHKCVGYAKGFTLKEGAIATSVSHDSHNLIVVGTNDSDMALACNTIIDVGGGCVVVKNGQVVYKMPLPIAGLMSELSAEEVAEQNEKLRQAVYTLGVDKQLTPFMSLAFISLPVIPNIKITTKGIVDVNTQTLLDLFV